MKKWILLAAALAGALTITACGDRAEDIQPDPLNFCLIVLFAGENFGGVSTPGFVSGAAKFSTLEDLPTNLRDWRGKIRSLQVGELATLQIWEKGNFQGTTTTYRGKTSVPNIDNFGSMEITCRQ